MKSIYQNILESIEKGERLLAVLIDPDKIELDHISEFMVKVNSSIVTHVFVGGSEVKEEACDIVVSRIKQLTQLPIVLFPGDVTQITDKADGLLFLSLISGRNPDYLIDKHVQSVQKLKRSNLEVIPTGYILIENCKETSVQKVTNTLPLSRKSKSSIVDTALAGELLGMKMIYLEAGSGATEPVSIEIIKEVKKNLNIPLIVGGGIKSTIQLENTYKSGADLVVIGTAFEENLSLFDELTR
jgi:putative glycerol-1-phosphate prenyltransferase